MIKGEHNSNLTLYLRLVAYLRPYLRHILVILFFNLGFIIFSTLSVWMVAPVITTLFETPNQSEITRPSNSEKNITPPVSVAKQKKSFNINRWLKEQTQRWLFRDNPRDMLMILCLFIIISFALKNYFAFAEFYWVSYVEQRVIKSLREDVYSHILNQPLSFFNRRKTGNLISHITNDIDALNVAVNRSFTKIIRDPVLILLFVFILFSINWQLSLAALIIFPVTTVIIQKIGRSLKRRSQRVQERIADITTNLQEVISGIKVVKAFGMEDYENQQFKQRTERHFRAVLRKVRLKRLASPLSETLGVTVMVGVLWYGGKLVLSGQLLSSEDFIRFIILLFSMMEPLKSLGEFNNNIQIALASGKRVFDILDTTPEITDKPGAVSLNSFKAEIAYRNVSFRYSPKNDWVLKNVNLMITKNQKVALVGSSGAGKSTLANLLPRFYDVSEGAIFIDNIDIRDVTQKSLRQLMGIVTQEVVLFNDTITNNIAYGKTDFTNEQIAAAAKLANAYDFIIQMPDGFDTVIGERGVLLSGGQRQRISIARAILKNPPILIFDEATSSLDSESEYLIQEAIQNLMQKRTVLIIAHRLSSIINADKIVILEQGRIIDQGSHEDLIERSRRYQRLYKLQYAASS